MALVFLLIVKVTPLFFDQENAWATSRPILSSGIRQVVHLQLEFATATHQGGIIIFS